MILGSTDICLILLRDFNSNKRSCFYADYRIPCLGVFIKMLLLTGCLWVSGVSLKAVPLFYKTLLPRMIVHKSILQTYPSQRQKEKSVDTANSQLHVHQIS